MGYLRSILEPKVVSQKWLLETSFITKVTFGFVVEGNSA